MEEEEYMSTELQRILEEFTRIKDAYLALKVYSETQEEALSIEKHRSEKLRENLEKLSNTFFLLEKRYKSNVEKLQAENGNFRKMIEELGEQCEHLRLVNADRNGSDFDAVCRLQDEVEILKSQLAMQEEKQNEDIAVLKQQHADEIQRYKMLLQNAKQGSISSKPAKRGRPKNSEKRKKNTSYFRWPELDITRANVTPMENEVETGNGDSRAKKRKLFHEDREIVVDIP
ncbi:PREDICTED: uncharacterized protein LOC108548292 [Eufriesea mexicana]|uniref:uncharacterized protein LOC108548292 n=1 Tax=Eufriesea mexicana TaxID=516756 RepID=UPI00083BAF18|nr:PREDICTED: uncharacterized protein LOC108548292 [Eufriesea mexicana]